MVYHVWEEDDFTDMHFIDIFKKKVQWLTGADFILLFHQTFLSVDLEVGIVKGRWHNLLSGFQRLSGTATIGFRTSGVTINERIFT